MANEFSEFWQLRQEMGQDDVTVAPEPPEKESLKEFWPAYRDLPQYVYFFQCDPQYLGCGKAVLYRCCPTKKEFRKFPLWGPRKEVWWWLVTYESVLWSSEPVQHPLDYRKRHRHQQVNIDFSLDESRKRLDTWRNGGVDLCNDEIKRIEEQLAKARESRSRNQDRINYLRGIDPSQIVEP